MMKTNNEMSATPSYTAPVAKLINAKLEGLICQSNGNSLLYSGSNKAGNDMNDDDNYSYDF